MQLIVFSGLPGTGKSAMAEAVGQAMGIPVFAKDWLEATLLRCELQAGGPGGPTLGYASYELLTVLAERQLRIGCSVILDSVASTASIRSEWRGLASRHGAQWRVIECICSDEMVHRARLGLRQRGIPGWHELTWADVERVKAYYAAWNEERLVLDALDPLPDNIIAALRYLSST